MFLLNRVLISCTGRGYGCVPSLACSQRFLSGLRWKPSALPWAEAEADRVREPPPSIARLTSVEMTNLNNWAGVRCFKTLHIF